MVQRIISILKLIKGNFLDRIKIIYGGETIINRREMVQRIITMLKLISGG